jgi:hypothetical protein
MSLSKFYLYFMSSSFLRLPFTFDPSKLEADFRLCLSSEWPLHFHKEDYAGSWTSIALRSISGDPGDIRSIPGAEYRDSFLLETCAYFREVLAHFQCAMETVRLLNLGAGGIIHEHRDPGAGYGEGALRIHIPILTNEKAWMTVGGISMQLKAGECWYADFGLPHSVRNEGPTDRVHLVIDGIRNAWTDELFRDAGYDFEAEKAKKAPSPETLKRMITELRLQGTEISLRLAEQLEKENGLAG